MEAEASGLGDRGREAAEIRVSAQWAKVLRSGLLSQRSGVAAPTAVRMKPSGTPNRGNRATRALRAIGYTQGWARATCNFSDFCEFA